MTSIIRVGQSKFVTAQIDEDSNERIMNYIQTLTELETKSAVQRTVFGGYEKSFLQDVASGCSRGLLCLNLFDNWIRNELQKRRKLRRRRVDSSRSVNFQRRLQMMP
jgi:vesicle coat complex subunit